MGVDDIRKKLAALNRGPLGERVVPASTLQSPTGNRKRGALAFDLPSMIPGQATTVGDGQCYVIDRRVRAVWKPGNEVCDQFFSTMENADFIPRAQAFHESLGAAAAADARSLLFVDLETCGFSGSSVFLIGALHVEAGDFRMIQLLARNHSEEPAILEAFAQMLRPDTHLVTFNGKSFDWPFLLDRATVHRIKLCQPAGHCDLLHVARRKYKNLLPNCKLQTLEQYICGRRRYGDVPGSQIPAAYHHFVRTGDATEIRDVVHHNFLDLVTLAEMLAVLLRTV